MNRKRIFAFVITVIMAVGLSFAITGCGEEQSQSQDEEQVVVEEETTEPEPTSQVAESVEECVALAGEYQDEVSQRATATVIANTEAQSLNITVTWGTSAFETSVWTMNATKDGNRLAYSDCKRTDTIISDDTDSEGTGNDEVGGGAEETVVYESGSGSFEISDDGKLLWTGAEDEECQSCVFVPISE